MVSENERLGMLLTSPSTCELQLLKRLELHRQLLRPRLIRVDRTPGIVWRVHHIVPTQERIVQWQWLLIPDIGRQAQLVGQHPPP